MGFEGTLLSPYHPSGTLSLGRRLPKAQVRLSGSPLRSIPCYLTADPQDTFHISSPTQGPTAVWPCLLPLLNSHHSPCSLLPTLPPCCSAPAPGPLHKWSFCLMCLGQSCFLRNSSLILTLAGGASDKEPACQCRGCQRCGFSPWVTKIPWRRAWQPTPVFLPGESHGQRSLEGYSPWDRRESDMTKTRRLYLLLLSPLNLFIIPGVDPDTSRSLCVSEPQTELSRPMEVPYLYRTSNREGGVCGGGLGQRQRPDWGRRGWKGKRFLRSVDFAKQEDREYLWGCRVPGKAGEIALRT